MMDEQFDIIDSDDNIIGKAARSEVHGNPALIHRVIHILLFNSDGEWFLQQRSWEKDTQPGKWDSAVGGHVDSGESYEEAAHRELEEELGIETADLVFQYKYLHRNDFESEMVSTYSCRWDGEIRLNPDEILDGRFWSLDEILDQKPKGIFTPLFLQELDRYHNHFNRSTD